MRQWFYELDGEKHGPIEKEKVLQLLEASTTVAVSWYPGRRSRIFAGNGISKPDADDGVATETSGLQQPHVGFFSRVDLTRFSNHRFKVLRLTPNNPADRSFRPSLPVSSENLFLLSLGVAPELGIKHLVGPTVLAAILLGATGTMTVFDDL